MLAALDKFRFKFEEFILFFILLQPLIDLLTTLSVSVLKINLTVGVFIRFLVMVLGIVYILWANRNDHKKNAIYIIFLGFFFFFNVLNNMAVKYPISLGAEVKLISKVLYASVILIVFITLFRGHKDKDKLYEKINKNILISMIIIGIVMVLSMVTGTGIKSYESIKLGWQGWFFAGNELGGILAICFPIIVLIAIKKTNSWSDWKHWIPVVLSVFSLLLLGTKVGYLAPLVVLIIALIMTGIDALKKKEKKWVIPSFIGIIIVLFGLSTPFTPVVFNTNTHLSWVGIEQPDHGKHHKKKKETKEKEIERAQVENLLLSGREQFLTQHEHYFAKAPISQKVLGMGYGGNYNKEPKMIEMDFYDLFYSFGYLGFLLILLPFFVLFIKIVINFFKDIKRNFTTSNVLIGTGIILGLGVAYTAGHVFTAPSVSIYLAVLFAYLASKFNTIK
jgi:hypothetical protein